MTLYKKTRLLLNKMPAMNCDLTDKTEKRPPHTSLLAKKMLQWSQILWIESLIEAQLHRLFYLRRCFTVVDI